MYCNACGQENPDGAWFCAKCGATVKQSTQTSPASARPTSASSTPSTTSESHRFSPPRSNLVGAAAAGTSEDEEWRAVIGPKNADYYLPKFAAAESGDYYRWHWPAFFVTGYWLLYRKMWGWSLMYLIVIPIVGSLLLGVLGAIAGPKSNVTAFLPLVWFLFILIAPPLVANQLYYSHCRNLIARTRQRFPDRARQLSYLDAKGGTSAIAIIIILVLAIAIVGILAAIALPAYQDYTRRAKVSEAVVGARAVATAVGKFYEANGRLPPDLDAIRGTVSTSKYLTSIELNHTNGVIDFEAQPDPRVTVPLTLTPSVGPDKHIAWKCAVSSPSMNKYVPSACRN
jgi:type II secretory pathway pseudopilin PulG